MLDYLGWVAMALTMLSFVFSKMIWLRMVNIAACVVWIIYGSIKSDYPVIATNAMIAIIHLIWIFKNNQREKRDGKAL